MTNNPTANEIAEFVRNNMAELNQHPMDYQDHYEYILGVYQRWLEREETENE